jgi:hypothetical protein
MSGVRDCWFEHHDATAHTANTTALLLEFFGERILGAAFGHRDHQTLPSFCGDLPKKEFIRITHEAWRN